LKTTQHARPRIYLTWRLRSFTAGSPDAEVEQISINLQAVPSFEAFGRFLETTNPFALWAQAAQLALFPWLGAASARASRRSLVRRTRNREVN
jgi:hypothetical protein